MDITLDKVTTISLIQHKPEYTITGYNTTLEIETEKGKVTLDMFSEEAIVLKLGRDD